MEQRVLGSSGLTVPVVGMGTWQTFDVRGDVAEQNASRIVDAALAAGANFFDSSPMYGRAERVLGKALEGRRESAMIATKVWARSLGEGSAQIDHALGCFGGYIDFYQVHNLVLWRDHLTVLERLQKEGKVRAIGATHYSASSFAELAEVMKTGRVSAVQIPYNPIQREVERVILPLAADLNIGTVIMRPFAEGALMRKPPSAEELAALGVETWAQALLKWSLSDPRCHVAIPATSRAGRMSENAAVGAPWFDAEQRALVSRLAAR